MHQEDPTAGKAEIASRPHDPDPCLLLPHRQQLRPARPVVDNDHVDLLVRKRGEALAEPWLGAVGQHDRGRAQGRLRT